MDFGRAMKQIGLAFRRIGDKMLESYGLTVPQMNLLLFLFRRQDENTDVIQRDIEEALHVSNPTVSGTLDRLEKNGFLRRELDPHNRRVNRIVLTEKAEDLKQISRKNMQQFERSILSPLSEEEQAKLYEMLNRIIENLPQ